MRKSTKIYIWAWAATLILLIGYVVWPSYHDLATDPHKVGAIVNLNLPDVAEYEYEDNLDRGTSHWDYFEYHATFAEEISEACIAEMERRCIEDSEHWSKSESGDYYTFADMDGELYEVGCAIYKDRVYVAYLIDEDEGMIVGIAVVVFIRILFWWGLALIAIHLIRKNTAKQIKEYELSKHNEAE